LYVTSGEPRHGRRDNGLVAAEYAAVGDVDPRVGEHLLDVLALDGIAAYLRPSTDLHPVTRSTVLPSRPTDRLYVDRIHVATARDYLTRLAEDRTAAAGIEAGESDVEDAWARIVAGYDTEVEAAQRSWPTAEDVVGSEPAAPPTRTWSLPVAAAEDQPSLLDGLDTFGADLPDDEDETFVPPAPPPVPRPSLPTALGVVGVIGGLIVFLQPSLLPISESVSMFLGFAAVVAGFGTLVWRLRPGDEDEDTDPDDGARV
jgi:hypothetical protein